MPPSLLYVRVPFCYFSFISPGATLLTPVLHSPAKATMTSFVDYKDMLGQQNKTAVLSVKDVVLSKLGLNVGRAPTFHKNKPTTVVLSCIGHACVI